MRLETVSWALILVGGVGLFIAGQWFIWTHEGLTTLGRFTFSCLMAFSAGAITLPVLSEFSDDRWN